jgi:hypothetical protein
MSERAWAESGCRKTPYGAWEAVFRMPEGEGQIMLAGLHMTRRDALRAGLRAASKQRQAERESRERV